MADDKPPFDPSQPFTAAPDAAPDKPPFDPSKPFEAAPPSAAADFVKSMPYGAARAWSGLASDFSKGLGAESFALGVDPSLEHLDERLNKGPTPEQSLAGIEQITGPLHRPETTAGKFGASAAEFAANPLSYLGPGGMLAKGVTAATAGLGSEAAGELTAGTKAEPYARLVGAVVGATAPAAGARAITPFPISAERQAAVDTLRGEGVQPTAGQVTGSKAIRYAESELGDAPFAGGKATAAQERQIEQFTTAALRRAGENAERATPAVVDRAFTRIGNQFDTLATRNAARYDSQFMQDVITARNNYDHLFLDPLHSAKVEKLFDRTVNNLIRNPQMEGEAYKAQRSQIERMRRATRDPELNMYLAEMRDAMDGLMERSIARNNPADLGAWRETRNQYRNMLVLERVAVGGGEQAAAGLVSPARLRQAVVGQSRRSYARGAGDFADLARAGNEIMSPLPQSGTGPRWFARAIPGMVGATLGSPGGLHGMGAGAAAGAVFGPAAAGRTLMSAPAQAYLRNQLLTRMLRNMPPTTARALMGAMTSNPFANTP